MTFTATGGSRSAAGEQDLRCTRKPQANDGMSVVSAPPVSYHLFQEQGRSGYVSSFFTRTDPQQYTSTCSATLLTTATV